MYGVPAECDNCGRPYPRDGLRDGLCFACRVRTVGFTFRGAHVGRKHWNEGTVSEYKREVYEGARESGTDITRV